MVDPEPRRRAQVAHLLSLSALALLGAPGSASAHESHGVGASAWEGFLHPILGIDHLLAMVAVGLVSVVLGGRHVWRVPGVFVAALAVGGGLGYAGFEFVGVELVIIVSIAAMGVALASRRVPPVELLYIGVVLFGLAHGDAHGLELPVAADALGYAFGFCAASVVCHLLGVGLGTAVNRGRRADRVRQVVGVGLVVAAGVLVGGVW